MPEGEAIHRTAAALRTALVGRAVLSFEAPHLDGHYTAFGECEPTQVVSKIAANQDTRIERVSVRFEKPCRE